MKPLPSFNWAWESWLHVINSQWKSTKHSAVVILHKGKNPEGFFACNDKPSVTYLNVHQPKNLIVSNNAYFISFDVYILIKSHLKGDIAAKSYAMLLAPQKCVAIQVVRVLGLAAVMLLLSHVSYHHQEKRAVVVGRKEILIGSNRMVRVTMMKTMMMTVLVVTISQGKILTVGGATIIKAGVVTVLSQNVIVEEW